MSWLPWRRPTPSPDPPPTRPLEEEEPESPPSTFAQRVERWRAIFRAEKAQQATPERLEAERARRRRAEVEAEEERIAMHIAFKNYFIEGEALAGPEIPPWTEDSFAPQREAFYYWAQRDTDAAPGRQE